MKPPLKLCDISQTLAHISTTLFLNLPQIFLNTVLSKHSPQKLLWTRSRAWFWALCRSVLSLQAPACSLGSRLPLGLLGRWNSSALACPCLCTQQPSPLLAVWRTWQDRRNLLRQLLNSWIQAGTSIVPARRVTTAGAGPCRGLTAQLSRLPVACGTPGRATGFGTTKALFPHSISKRKNPLTNS